MKIVQINTLFGPGSTGRTGWEMHEFLKREGIESYNFYSEPNKDSDPNEIFGNKLDHKIHGFLSRLFGRQAYFSTIPTYNLIRKLKTIQPDVVVLRILHSNCINLPMLLNFLASYDIATVVVLHDCWFFTGHCCHYTEVGCQKWQTECHHCPLIRTNNISWFLDNSRSIFRDKRELFGAINRLAVVGVSDWIANEARKAPIFEKAKIIQRIYNWIDLNKFYPRDISVLRNKLGLKEDDFVALGVSLDWNFRKGMEVYFEIAKAMPDIKVVMVGHISETDYPSNIINVPPTKSTEELAQYYSMADVLFNFSIQETFGKVAAEALACGTPLIVNDVTANPEIPGECGFYIKDNNLQEIVKAVRTIKEKGKSAYSQMCVDRAHLLFEKDKNMMQYVELFTSLQKMKSL